MLLRPMTVRPGRLRRIAALAAVAAIPVLAGCEAGNNAPVLTWPQLNNGANISVPAASGPGFIGIRNVFVLGPAAGAALPAGSSVGAFAVLTNTGARDRLVSVSAPGTATSVSLPSGGVTIGQNSTALLSGPAPQIVLRGLKHALTSGSQIRMVFAFQNAGTVRISVPVLPKAQYLESYSPPAASPSATPSGKHHRKGAVPTVSGSPVPAAGGTSPSPSSTP
jgi:copper(I)-binding protein